MVAHFSPLMSGCGNHAHFLAEAPVLKLAWSKVAIHILHQMVCVCVSVCVCMMERAVCVCAQYSHFVCV